MKYRLPRAFERLERALNQLGTRLGEHLDGYIAGNFVLFDEVTHKVEVWLRGCWEADLNFLKANFTNSANIFFFCSTDIGSIRA